MDRNSREARRVNMAASNGLSRRRYRSNSLRDSPDDDGPVDLHETARLRDRGTGKRDRERDRDRDRERDREKERDRDRERERDRDRLSSRTKRRRGDRMLHGSTREDGGDETSEESVNDEEDEDVDDGGGVGAGPGGSSMRTLPPNPSSLSSISNHHHRKSFPPAAKLLRPSPPASAPATIISSAPWKAPDEMIGVSVPRKARTASTKRSHEWVPSLGGAIGGGEPIHRQASASPVRSSGPIGTAVLGSASASPASASPPSSSNFSVKKRMKPNGPKQRPPKSSSTKTTSSAQEEIEMEIAEVLYGLMKQPQNPLKQEIVANDSVKFDSRDVNNIKLSSGDAKSRVSSPISNSASTIPHSSLNVPSFNSTSSGATPVSAIAPKRKRPRPVKNEDEIPGTFTVRSSPVSSTAKVDSDQPSRVDSPLNVEKNSVENGAISYDFIADQTVRPPTEQQQPEAMKLDTNNMLSDLKPKPESEALEIGTKEEIRSPKEESRHALKVDDDREGLTATKANSTVCEIEIQREEKFQIDLMAPPPSRSSVEREREIDFVAVDPIAKVTDVETESKATTVKEDDKPVKIVKGDVNVEPEEKKTKVRGQEVECRKPVDKKDRNIDLQFDLEKSDRDASASGNLSGNKLQLDVQKQQQQQQPNSDKTAQSGSLSFPMSVASWPAGLPHMGYVAPFQGVVSVDGSSVPSASMQPPHLFFSHPRPKRCATHCLLARNIHYLQQLARINPFWPATAGSALQYGAKACNIVPPSEMHAGRGVNTVQDKGPTLSILPGHTVTDKTAQASNIVETTQRKQQILLQQGLPAGAPNNFLHGSAFIFPLSQPQAAASVRPGNMKSTATAGGTVPSNASNSASISATVSGAATATAMSFNYPNMSGNETQYLAILQNGAYPIPVPAHVGATPAYRGAHPQAMPFFNGSFYSSQMLHPSQLQQQQPPPTQSQQSQPGHQNPSISSGSSSSQKHLQNQLQRPHSSGANSGSGHLQGFPTPKNQPLPPPQQRQPSQNQNPHHHARHLESELGGEDSPSTDDSRISRANMSIYGQNFAMPITPPNFALMTPASMSGSSSASGNPSEKKQQQQPQQQGSKAGLESLPSQAFAMSFSSINGASAAPGIDISSLVQNHALLQSLPEAARHSVQFMAAAAAAQAAAQQKKNFRVYEEGKAGGNDASNVEEERKGMVGGKAPAAPGHSIAFSRSDLVDTSASTMPANSVNDSSARSLNLSSAPARVTGSVPSSAVSTVNTTSLQQQLQRNQQQQHQIIQLNKQNQFAAAAAAAATARSKTPATSNGSVYSEHISSSSMASKFPNALATFPQSFVQSSGSPGQSPQWKSSARTSNSQVPTASLTSAPSLKSLPQQQGRNQQGQTQISFATNAKSSVTTQGQPPPSGNPSPSSPMVVGSPTTSSVSKSAGGSPRTSTSASNKGGHSSSLSHQAKNSPSGATQKSSPVGGRNIPSILGHPHNSSSSSSASRSQLPQQQHLTKHALPPAQMLYTSAYMQAQPQHTVSSSANPPAPPAGGFYIQRHRTEQQQPQGSSTTSSTGMLTMCPPVSLGNTSTTDPAKAVVAAAAAAAAAAAGNMKGGAMHSQGLIHAQFAAAQSSGKQHQLLPAGFPYVHAVQTAVQVKPGEHKQPAAE